MLRGVAFAYSKAAGCPITAFGHDGQSFPRSLAGTQRLQLSQSHVRQVKILHRRAAKNAEINNITYLKISAPPRLCEIKEKRLMLPQRRQDAGEWNVYPSS